MTRRRPMKRVSRLKPSIRQIRLTKSTKSKDIVNFIDRRDGKINNIISSVKQSKKLSGSQKMKLIKAFNLSKSIKTKFDFDKWVEKHGTELALISTSAIAGTILLSSRAYPIKTAIAVGSVGATVLVSRELKKLLVYRRKKR